MSLPYLIRWGFFCEANLNWVIEAVHFQVEPCEEESGQYLVNISPQISECAVYQWSLKSGVIKPKWAVWAGLISGPTCHISGWLNSVSGILFEKNPQYRQTWTVHSQCCLHLLCFSLHLPWRLCQGQVQYVHQGFKWDKFGNVFNVQMHCIGFVVLHLCTNGQI